MWRTCGALDDGPLLVAEAKRVEDALLPPMRALLDAVLRSASEAEVVASIEELIKKRVDTFGRY